MADPIIKPSEKSAMDKVADDYNLNPDQRMLLYTIRKVENGGPGKEFGVLAPEAMRFKNDPKKSFETQAKWAAGTIKRRYSGDLESFSKRWAPVGAKNDPKGLNKNWLKNARYYCG